MNKNLTNIKTEYFLIVNGVKQLFCYKTKEERNIMITAFLIGALLFLAAFMINICIIRRF